MKNRKGWRKIIPATIMLVVAAITMTSASYAWFTMSNKVQVEGIELTVVAPTNLLIREVGSPANNFSNVAAVLTNPVGKLNHASSVTGETMFTVADAKTQVSPDGTLTAVAEIEVTTTPVGAVDGFYVDFFFELVNTGAIDVTVGLNNLIISEVTTSAAGSNINGAIRFAILEDGTDNTTGIIFAEAVETVQAYQAAGTYGTAGLLGPQVSSTADAIGLFDVLGGGVANTTTPVNEKAITVRVWIEGQDLDCVSLNGSSFSISFDLIVIE